MLIDKELTDEINALIKKAVFQFNRRNLDEAREMFFKVLEKDPSNPEANYYIGLILSKEDKWERAVVHFKSVVDLGSNFLYTQQCRMLLGLIYFKNNEFKRAEYEFKEVLKSNVNIVQVYAALSAIKYYLNEDEEAVRYAEKAYEIDPFNLNAKNTYAYLLCEYEIDIEKGLEMLREVVRVKSNNPAYLDSLAWAYYKKGDIKAALASLRQALDISENNPEIKEHFDIVYGAL